MTINNSDLHVRTLDVGSVIPTSGPVVIIDFPTLLHATRPLIEHIQSYQEQHTWNVITWPIINTTLKTKVTFLAIFITCCLIMATLSSLYIYVGRS